MQQVEVEGPVVLPVALKVARPKVDASLTHRTKVLHLESSSYQLAAALVAEGLPCPYVRPAAYSCTRRLALSLGEDARGYGSLPTFVSGSLLRVRNDVFQGRRFLHRDKIRFRLGEIIRRRLPGAHLLGRHQIT